MRAFIATFFFCFCLSVIGSMPERALVGFPENVREYCFEKFDENNKLTERKCRKLVLTDGASDGFYNFYERFQKWGVDESNILNLTTDSVTYLKDNEAFFDEKVSVGRLHELDLFYPENTQVEVAIKSNRLPRISNIYLGRFENSEQLGHANVTIDYSYDSVKITGEYKIFEKDEYGNIMPKPQRFPISEKYLRVF